MSRQHQRRSRRRCIASARRTTSVRRIAGVEPPALTASALAAFKALTYCRRPPRRENSGLSSAAPAVPVLFRLAPDRGRCRVLDLQPVIDPTGAVGRAEALRHDALAAERAGVLEEHRAVAEVMTLLGGGSEASPGNLCVPRWVCVAGRCHQARCGASASKGS
jgi:hypothetical protein